MLHRSFDIIGNKEKAIAIVNFSPCSKKFANEIMKRHKNVKTVLENVSPREGVYRTRKYKIVAGSRNTEVIHIESGFRFSLDIRKVYFSQREGTERQRIAKLIKKGETVMVFFAGVGPFAIVAAKKAKKVIGIEINPDAVKYFKKNIILNKLNNIEVVLGDVKQKAKKYYRKCDRVLMPLPESSLSYLEEAVKCLKPGGVCHFYFFSTENEIKKIKKEIKNIAKVRFLKLQRVLPYGPRIWKMRLDFKLLGT